MRFDFLKETKWKALLGLAAVWAAVALNWNWIWGVIFLIWVIQEIKSGRAYFVEEVERFRNPVIYWLIIVSWLLMSIYLITAAISPKLNPESREFLGYKSTTKYISVPTKVNKCSILAPIGKEKNIATKDSFSTTKVVKTSSKQEKQKDTLKYSIVEPKAMCFVGVSIKTTYENGQYKDDIKTIWNYFFEKDISSLVKNKLDKRIYAVYSDYGGKHDNYFRVTIGYKTSANAKVYKGLNKILIPAKRFAALSTKEKGKNAINNLWDKVIDSDLNENREYSIEIYDYDKNYDVKNNELWISLKE